MTAPSYEEGFYCRCAGAYSSRHPEESRLNSAVRGEVGRAYMTKLAGLYRKGKLGAGKRSPWTGEVYDGGWSEKSRGEPKVLREPGSQHAL